MDEQRTPFRVRCSSCDHVWTAIWTPMPMHRAAKALGALHCPMCGEGADKIHATSEIPKDASR